MTTKYTVLEKIKMLKKFVALAHKCEIYGADLLDAIYASPHLSCLSISTVCLIALNNTPDNGEFFDKLLDSYGVFITCHGKMLREDDFLFDIENNIRVSLGADGIWRTKKREGYIGYAEKQNTDRV